jgi:hypothetical protein
MIVAAADTITGRTIVVGLSEADIAELRKGLTKVKQGNTAYGFSSLVVFLGNSDEEMIKTLSQAGTVRSDDKFPKAGWG